VAGRDIYGNTVLHVASVGDHVDVCKLLLQQTATDDSSSMSLIDVLNNDGCTPLDLAKSRSTRG